MDKQLLLKDLCARLPYGVKVNFKNVIHTINALFDDNSFWLDDKDDGLIEDIKPYLRPLSSMTEEEFESLKEYSGLKYDQLDLVSYQNGTHKCFDFYLSEVPSYVVILVFDWFNAHHFDYRGLIERGLAIEALEGMYND